MKETRIVFNVPKSIKQMNLSASLSKRLFHASSTSHSSIIARRLDAKKIFDDAVKASCPSQTIIRNVIGDLSSESHLSKYNRIVFAGAGKASVQLTYELMNIFIPDHLDDDIHKDNNKRRNVEGLIITKYHHTPQNLLPIFNKCNIQIVEAAHPVPDASSESAAKRMLDLLKSTADERTLVVFACTGGASALTSAPLDGITLDDIKATTKLLLSSGAEISEINTIRKHLTLAHGGRCAAMASPSTVLTFAISDVLGDNLEIIGGGPTAQNTSTLDDVRRILGERKIIDQLPSNIKTILADDEKSKSLIPPYLGAHDDGKRKYFIVASNRQALEKAKESAINLGYKNSMILTSVMRGEAKEVGKLIASIAANESLFGEQNKDEKACLIFGGETTVDLGSSPGKGGRNQEMALSIGIELLKMKEEKSSTITDQLTILCAGTDGTDGPTDVAGALVDATVVHAGNKIVANQYLSNHDSYSFFDLDNNDTDAFIIAGEKGSGTGTNVCDIVICLKN